MFNHVAWVEVCTYSLFTGFLEKRDISHVRFPKKYYLELTSFFLGLLLFLAFLFFFPLLLFLNVFHRDVVRVSTDTWMGSIDAYVSSE